MEINMKNHIWMCLLAGAALLFMSGVVTAGTHLLDDAKGLFEARQYDKAISLVEKEIRKSGESADLLVMMADCYAALEKTGKAEKIYRQALALDPGHQEGSLNLGMLLVAKRERNEAIALFKKVLNEKPDHARAHFCLGMAYNARADINDAFGQYKILKRLDKKLAEKLYNAIFLK